MGTEVTLPELGESVTDGILTAWLVEVGDTVEVDQPLFEISTDKIDTEVPSPVAGTVQERRAEVDDTIEVGQVLLVIGDGDGGGAPKASAPAEEAPAEEAPAKEAPKAEAPKASPPPQASAPAASAPKASAPQAAAPVSVGDTSASGDAALMSPLVRKILRDAGITADQVTGTGQGGRITRADAEQAVASGPAPAAATSASAAPIAASAAAASGPVGIQSAAAPPRTDRPAASPTQIDFGGERSVTNKLSRVRVAIAKSMMNSMQTTAQLTAGVEVDVTRVMNTRLAHKDAFKAKYGASLSPLPIISRAVLMTLPRHPVLNSSINTDDGTTTYHRYVNLGMAVDTERGLLVPNIKDAQDLTIPAIAQRISDLAKRTRGKGLQPDEISGGTFTITNTGSVGTLFDTPILNPPEVAILATCAIEKRPVVVNDGLGDSIAIRWMTYLCLSYDHRQVDGADAARFLQDLKFILENHDFSHELA